MVTWMTTVETATALELDREAEVRLQERIQDHVDDFPMSGLTLPRGEEREAVEFRDREYTLSGSETRALATVGAFRVVVSEDFNPRGRSQDASQSDWRHLSEQGLLTRETLTDRDGARHVMALTREGKALLDAHREPRKDGRQQEYYAGVVKPRELRHDAQLYRVYQAEAARIEREGGRVTRVVLDYELKRDYQRFLNRKDRPDDADVARRPPGVRASQRPVRHPRPSRTARSAHRVRDRIWPARASRCRARHRALLARPARRQGQGRLRALSRLLRRARKRQPTRRHAARSTTSGATLMTFDERVARPRTARLQRAPDPSSS